MIIVGILVKRDNFISTLNLYHILQINSQDGTQVGMLLNVVSEYMYA